MYKPIILNNVALTALIDTGSDLTIIRKDSFMRSGFKNFVKSNTMIVGLNSNSQSNGTFEAIINIDGHIFEVECHVVSSNVIKPDCIIGMDLLEQAEVNISKSGDWRSAYISMKPNGRCLSYFMCATKIWLR